MRLVALYKCYAFDFTHKYKKCTCFMINMKCCDRKEKKVSKNKKTVSHIIFRKHAVSSLPPTPQRPQYIASARASTETWKHYSTAPSSGSGGAEQWHANTRDQLYFVRVSLTRPRHARVIRRAAPMQRRERRPALARSTRWPQNVSSCRKTRKAC